MIFQWMSTQALKKTNVFMISRFQKMMQIAQWNNDFMRMQKICFIHPIGKQLNHTRTLILCKYTFAQFHLTSQNRRKNIPKSMEKCSKIIIKMNTELKYFLASFFNWFLSILGSLEDTILDLFFCKNGAPVINLFHAWVDMGMLAVMTTPRCDMEAPKEAAELQNRTLLIGSYVFF